MLDLQLYYAKLVNKEAISEDDIVGLLKELAHYRGVAAYLASCHASTLEGLNKSASTRTRERLVEICKSAAGMLDGDSAARYTTNIEVARQRCAHAAVACNGIRR